MPEIHGKKFELYISEEEINERLKSLSELIQKDYKNSTPLFISILNGAFIFTADLVRNIWGEVELSFVKVKSYHGTQSSGNAKTMIGLGIDIRDKDVILIDDIIDTGHTFKYLIELLKISQPRSIKTCCLLFKKESFKENFQIDYIGFEIDNRFVVGYGLDYDEIGRNLKDIYALAE